MPPSSEERRYDIALVINELLANSFEHLRRRPEPRSAGGGPVREKPVYRHTDGGEGFEVEETLEKLAQSMDEDDLYKERGEASGWCRRCARDTGDRGNNVGG